MIFTFSDTSFCSCTYLSNASYRCRRLYFARWCTSTLFLSSISSRIFSRLSVSSRPVLLRLRLEVLLPVLCQLGQIYAFR